MNDFLSPVVACVPVGTNLGRFRLRWMLLSGRLLQSRGAVIVISHALAVARALETVGIVRVAILSLQCHGHEVELLSPYRSSLPPFSQEAQSVYSPRNTG